MSGSLLCLCLAYAPVRALASGHPPRPSDQAFTITTVPDLTLTILLCRFQTLPEEEQAKVISEMEQARWTD